ncbi:entericidin [Pleomorphomonas sp. NRK KF1]|jgi:entericidin B|uniref:entericidin domain-containing protein n=1 Tax=Pleomorphomonas sp. NRK KF1 TaxID=2943000 RepID=UPI002043D445|nr:entericidin [Pleomorphomonas sp. NRK KF1]MCM5555820.1 entericidin [Pleomorphomonas sp. NRK KF1]
MSVKSILSIGVVALSVVAFGGCANTIRGAGQDTANAVNATQAAGNNIGNAAAR